MNLVRTGRIILLVAVLSHGPALSSLQAADPPMPGMITVYLTLLKKGPKWTAEKTEATKAIQEGHMANIMRLWKEKKMFVAGPIEDPTGDLRGIFIINATSLDEAKALAATDPAVKAGRLEPVVYPWWVEARALPQAGFYCDGSAPE